VDRAHAEPVRQGRPRGAFVRLGGRLPEVARQPDQGDLDELRDQPGIGTLANDRRSPAAELGLEPERLLAERVRLFS
jgi:hypothetical protein